VPTRARRVSRRTHDIARAGVGEPWCGGTLRWAADKLTSRSRKKP
jgi:hypothetical protein